MTQDDYARKLEELDQLLNNPDVPMDPSRVWSLLADLSGRDASMAAQRAPRGGMVMRAGAGGSGD